MGSLTSAKGIVLSMLKIGVIGFGGGSALIPVIEREIVEEKKLLSPDEYLKHTVIANITPGAMPAKLGACAGLVLAGPAGSVLSAFAVALPGAAMSVLLLLLFGIAGGSALTLLEYASLGISAFIVCLLIGYIKKVLGSDSKGAVANICIMALTFLLCGGNRLTALISQLTGQKLAAPIPGLSTIQVMMLAFTCVFIYSLLNKAPDTKPAPKKTQAGARAIALCTVVFLGLPLLVTLLTFAVNPDAGAPRFAGLVALSAITSFGGGEAYVAVADGFFVQSGSVDSSIFYGHIVPICNALPGPILIKVATSIGYQYGAQAGGALSATFMALCGFTVTTGVCSWISVLALTLYTRLSGSAFVLNLKRFILPVVCGLLISTSLAMAHEGAAVADRAGMPAWAAFPGFGALVAGNLWIHSRTRMKDLALLTLSGGLSLLTLLLLDSTG